MITTLFRFFASLKLAIFLLLTLALAFAVGTFVESAYGAGAAKLLVYDTPWLTVLLLLLALNVAASALDRLPWQKRHVGFVVTHCGILLMLAGSLMTRAFGIEGQMAIEEGQTQSRMTLSQPVVEFFSGRHGESTPLFPKSHAFAWQGRKKLHTNPDVWLLHDYPKARREEILRESSEGPAALEVSLTSSFTNVRQTLVLDDPERSRVNLGPAELSFSREPLAISRPDGAPPEELLEFRFEKSSIQVPLPKSFPKKISLKGTPYEVTVLRVLKDAVVDDQKNELVDRSGEWNNPACELILKGKGIEERHTVFSKYPDFPTMHGMKPSEAGVRIFFHRHGGEASAAKNELRFVWQENSPPRYQIRSGDKITEGVIPVGEEVPMGWMDFKFRVENYYPHAEMSENFTPLPAETRSEESPSALELEIEEKGEKQSLWLAQGDHRSLRLGSRDYEFVYGLRTLPVGFRLELKDFRIEKYPGTNQPASFESDVILKDDSTGSRREVNISMNRPLQHRGFRVFQSGYQQPEGGPEISIFSVAKDPGIPLKYAGSIILVLGTLLMFYTRKFSNQGQGSFSKSKGVLVS